MLSLIASRPWRIALDRQCKTSFLFMESVLQYLSCAVAKRGLCCFKSYGYSSLGLSVKSDSCGDIG